MPPEGTRSVAVRLRNTASDPLEDFLDVSVVPAGADFRSSTLDVTGPSGEVKLAPPPAPMTFQLHPSGQVTELRLTKWKISGFRGISRLCFFRLYRLTATTA